MIKISKKFEYALMSMAYFHEHEGNKGVRSIAEDLQIPFDTLSKVFQTLVHAQILKPTHGAQGGHCLQKPLQEIKFMDFYRLFEETPFGDKCNGPKDFCDIYSQCKIVAPLKKLHERLFDFFNELTLYELFYENKDK